MEKLNFDVYIGTNMYIGQGANIKAIVNPKFFMPHGNFRVNGESKETGAECFDRLYDLGTYFADWLDFVDDYDLINATVYLNVKSLHKHFCGKEIVEFIDKLEKTPNYENMRSFDEVQ